MISVVAQGCFGAAIGAHNAPWKSTCNKQDWLGNFGSDQSKASEAKQYEKGGGGERQVGECENKLLCECHHEWRTQVPKQKFPWNTFSLQKLCPVRKRKVSKLLAFSAYCEVAFPTDPRVWIQTRPLHTLRHIYF